MRVIKNVDAVCKWFNAQRKKGAEEFNMGSRKVAIFPIRSLDLPITVGELEHELSIFGGDDVMTQRAFELRSFKSAANGAMKVVSRLKLDVDLSSGPPPEEDEPEFLKPLFDWEIWSSKDSSDVALRFRDGDSDYQFDMKENDLERLYRRIGDFLKIGPRKGPAKKSASAVEG